MQSRKTRQATPSAYPLVPLSLVLILIFWGCASASAPGQTAQESAKPPNIENRLRAAGRVWQRTPHRMGGHDRRGIDCSGLTQVLFKELFGIQLPRTTGQQVLKGKPVNRKALAAGDLLFFRPPGKKRHVGIYLGQGEFLHTSTHRGVMISRLEEYYWRHCYWTARRVLTPDLISN